MANTAKKISAKKQNKTVIILLGAAVVVIVSIFIIKGVFGNKAAALSAGGDLVIPKSEITGTARYYPYKAGNTKMEILAVQAPDGTMRTAFNTCQVCYDSGRGYYKQEGDELVCQNCGNRFELSQVEKIRGGCNPVPIFSEDKTDDGSNITIPEAFLEKNKGLFGNWRKG